MLIKKEAVNAMKQYVCPICGFVHVGDVPPEPYPVRKQAAEKLVRIEEDNTPAKNL